jgi:hypothetical protein
LHFQSFSRMGRTDTVDKFGERFLFLRLRHALVRIIGSWVR